MKHISNTLLINFSTELKKQIGIRYEIKWKKLRSEVMITFSLYFQIKSWFHWRRRSKENIKPEIYIIRLSFSCKIWTLTKFKKWKKTFPLPKHQDIAIISISPTREKLDLHVLSKSDFWMVWRSHCIPCVSFYILV